MKTAEDDVQLMLRYQNGDLAAFGRLYSRHQGALYRYLLRHTRNATAVADLSQEVWSRLVGMRMRYEPRAKFATFLFHIAHNCAVDFHRRDGRNRSSARHAAVHVDSPEIEQAAPEHQQPDRMAEYGEEQSALLAALSALPGQQRDAFLLREATGLSIEDIAWVTSVPVETAKSRLRYAIAKLKRSHRIAADAYAHHGHRG